MPARGDLILVKLGGSLLTDKKKPDTVRPRILRRLAGEIARARAEMPEQLLVGHGSGSFGHTAAQRYAIANGISDTEQLAGVGATQAAAARLHRLVLEALAKEGLPAYSLSPSSCLVTRHGRPSKLFLDPFLQALSLGLLPVLYGDAVLDSGQGAAIASTETVLTALARRLPRRGLPIVRVLWLGATAGVLDSSGSLIPRLDQAAFPRLEGALAGAAGVDVTGGMRHRVDTALLLARKGIPSLIADGRQEGLLERALRGEEVPGTLVPAV